MKEDDPSQNKIEENDRGHLYFIYRLLGCDKITLCTYT